MPRSSSIGRLIYGIKEMAAHGPDVRWMGSIATGLVVALIFIRRQRIVTDPMIDLALFRRRAFSGSIAMNLVAMFGLVGFAIFNTQYLQSVLGMKPLEAALWSLLGSVGVAAATPVASMLA